MVRVRLLDELALLEVGRYTPTTRCTHNPATGGWWPKARNYI
jgi:hypothetical protein